MPKFNYFWTLSKMTEKSRGRSCSEPFNYCCRTFIGHSQTFLRIIRRPVSLTPKIIHWCKNVESNLHTVTMRKHLLNNIFLNHNLEAFSLIIYYKQKQKSINLWFFYTSNNLQYVRQVCILWHSTVKDVVLFVQEQTLVTVMTVMLRHVNFMNKSFFNNSCLPLFFLCFLRCFDLHWTLT